MEILPIDNGMSDYYDRDKEVEEFDKTKAGVKGLVDSGVSKIPRFFIHHQENLPKMQPYTKGVPLNLPIIDIRGIDTSHRQYIVDNISKASATWGFFQVINHGISLQVMENMLEGIRRFHEQDGEVKKEYYSRDHRRKVRYYCNGDLLVSKVACWRDSVAHNFDEDHLAEQEGLPLICRQEVLEYMEGVMKLRETLSKLLSDALGLDPDYFHRMECMKTKTLVCHFYPSCPEPELTLGARKHSDPSFLTLLLQDSLGGLQVLHQDHWIDVVPVKGALVANVGDLLQLLSNDKFKSVEHRVVASHNGPRLSAACFFYPSNAHKLRPIAELLTENSPPSYREVSSIEYLTIYRSKGLDGNSALQYFKTNAPYN